jgi:hypothetical protein
VRPDRIGEDGVIIVVPQIDAGTGEISYRVGPTNLPTASRAALAHAFISEPRRKGSHRGRVPANWLKTYLVAMGRPPLQTSPLRYWPILGPTTSCSTGTVRFVLADRAGLVPLG